MDGMTHPVLGEVEVGDVGGPSWDATVEWAGHRVELVFRPGDAPLDASQVQVLADLAARLADLDRSSRLAMRHDHGEYGLGLYFEHHRDELGEAGLAAALGIAAPVNAEQFIEALRLSYVSVGPDEPPMTLDYTIDTDLTNYVLAVSMNNDGEVVAIVMES
jgi:hypothetical protein